MTYKEKKTLLRNELKILKSEGLRVFLNKDSWFGNYALITDNTDIIYVQFAENSPLFEVYIKYMQNGMTGYDCKVITKDDKCTHLSKKLFEETVAMGKEYIAQNNVTPYTDIRNYFDRNPRKEKQYIEL